MDAVSSVVPKDFRFDIDFNATLLNADHAVPILQGLKKKYPNFAICESPIPQDDVDGGKRIRQAVKLPIAHHYGGPPIAVQLGEGLCDGFVLTGGASQVLREGRVCQEFDKPFWLQQVGSGLTAAFSMHLAAVLSHATWPAVNCHQLYQHDVLAEPIAVRQGTARIPDSPGLGVEVDEGALAELRLSRPYEGFNPKRLIEVAWPGGARFYYSSGNQLWRDAQAGNMPVFVTGVETRLLPDDGSARWRELHAQASKAPVRQGDPLRVES
jgi:L-alanine-DL-glutamate epimerase-like enolase superfamily enzyme